jgi:hypothetical protein
MKTLFTGIRLALFALLLIVSVCLYSIKTETYFIGVFFSTGMLVILLVNLGMTVFLRRERNSKP